MASTLDQTQNKGVFALFKGESGTGKTVAALSFPNVMILDHDQKMPAIARKHFPGKDIHYEQLEDVFEIADLLANWATRGCPYETVVGDSITSLSYTALKTVDTVKGKNVIDNLRDALGKKGKNINIELRGFDYYNAEDNFLKFYIDVLKGLWKRDGNPKHVIILGHVLTTQSEDIKTKIVTTTRRIVTAGKNIAAYIPAQFDEVWHFYTKLSGLGSGTTVQRICSTEAIGDDYAKTAYRLQREIDFTNGSLFELIRGQLELVPQIEASSTEMKLTPVKKPLSF